MTLARKPDYVNFCNCSACRPMGAGWGYLASGEVEIAGNMAEFGRTDVERCLTFHFCPACGSTVAWTPYGNHEEERMGVNMRLFPLDEVTGIPAVWSDGLAMTDDSDTPTTRTGHGTMGDGKAF